MNCTIYRSELKAYTYLYLAEGKALDELPEMLLGHFGHPVFVMDLDLGKRNKLALANLETVKSKLRSQGYYLQFPPEQDIEELLERRFNPTV